MTISTRVAAAIVGGLIEAGVREVVLAPGSRNAPLSLALHAADACGQLRLHVRVDERTAGFLALGLARGSGRPAAVVTTSGTAVANLHPAVLEAHHGGVPLVVVSADRPARLRGVGANQTIDQHAVFGGGVLRARAEADDPATARVLALEAVHAAAGDGDRPGPAQLNVAFDVPLLPPDYAAALAVARSRGGAVTSGAASWIAMTPSSPVAPPAEGERCLVVADLTNSTGVDLRRLAAGFPVVSEAGGAAGAGVLAAGLALLADEDFLAAHPPERVLVLGRPTLYRQVAALLARRDLVVDMVVGREGPADVAGTARTISPALGDVREGVAAPPRWLAAWRAADTAARTVLAARTAPPGAPGGPLGSAQVAAAVVRSLPVGAALVLGSSQPPRDVGWFAAARDGVTVFANRGVAGIDGTVSTAVGIALARTAAGAAGSTVALLGDLTLVHDATGLAIGPGEPRPDLTLVVVNNDGGAIFALLEQGAPEYAPAFERVFGTAVGADLAALAAAFGARHERVTDLAGLTAALAGPAVPGGGLRLVEVAVPRAGLRHERAEIAAELRAAVRGLRPADGS